VLLENARVRLAVESLRNADLAGLGQLMYESHASLRHDYRVSCAELDTVADLARTIPGIHGARMTGAGFGGCAIALLDPNAMEAATRQITDGFTKAHGHPCHMFVATA
jgi:galactokinase